MKNQKSKIKSQNLLRGFSLVEILIYVFLIALLTIAVVNSLVFMTKSYQDIRSAKAITLSANRFSYEVKKSSDLSEVFGSSSNTLSLTQGSSTVIFSLESSSSRILISTNGIQDYLTSSDTKVTTLTFLKLQATSTSKGAIIQFTISNSNGNNIKTENFESSAVIRNPNI